MKVKLGDVCERGSSNVAQKDISDMEGEYPIYGAAGCSGNVDFYHQEKPYVAVVKDGAGIGRTMLLPAKSSVIGTLQYLLPKENVLPEYLYYVVRHMHLEKYFTGATIPHIYFKDYQNEEFILAKMSEQRKIVAVLKKIEKAIELRMQEIKLLDTLVKARFVEMFGDISERATMDQVCSIITDGTHQPPQFIEEGIPFIFVSNLANNEVTYNAEKFITNETYEQLIQRTPIEIGDLLLTTVGSYGHPAVIKYNKKFLFQRHIAYLKPKRNLVSSAFLYGFLLSADGQRQIEERVKGIAQKTLNLSEIKKLRLPLPLMEWQNAFASFVTQTDKSKAAIQKSLDETRLLFDSLMQKYFG